MCYQITKFAWITEISVLIDTYIWTSHKWVIEFYAFINITDRDLARWIYRSWIGALVSLISGWCLFTNWPLYTEGKREQKR